MIARAELFVEGEVELGHYQVAVGRKTSGEWITTIPPLNVLTTNYRFILWPQTLRPYPPASIPCTYILEAREVQLSQYSGVLLRLITGHRITLVVGSDQVKALRDNIRHMVRPPRDNPLFTSNIATHDIRRLVRYFADV